MKHLRYVWLVLALLLGRMPSTAQEETFPTSTFSLYAGPSWYVGKLLGITRQAASRGKPIIGIPAHALPKRL